jgi:hypothetical protein
MKYLYYSILFCISDYNKKVQMLLISIIFFFMFIYIYLFQWHGHIIW